MDMPELARTSDVLEITLAANALTTPVAAERMALEILELLAIRRMKPPRSR